MNLFPTTYPPDVPNFIQLAMIALGWILFGFFHSLFASEKTKTIIHSKLKIKPTTYRKTYVTISSITSLFLILYSYSDAIIKLFSEVNLIYNTIIYSGTVAILGLSFIFLAFYHQGKNSLLEFLGIIPEKTMFTIKGVYRFCRHPIYTGTFLLIFAALILAFTPRIVVSSSILIIYLLIGSVLEEKRIQNQEPLYKAYKKQVGRFFPWKKQHFITLLQKQKR